MVRCLSKHYSSLVYSRSCFAALFVWIKQQFEAEDSEVGGWAGIRNGNGNGRNTAEEECRFSLLVLCLLSKFKKKRWLLDLTCVTFVYFTGTSTNHVKTTRQTSHVVHFFGALPALLLFRGCCCCKLVCRMQRSVQIHWWLHVTCCAASNADATRGLRKASVLAHPNRDDSTRRQRSDSCWRSWGARSSEEGSLVFRGTPACRT